MRVSHVVVALVTAAVFCAGAWSGAYVIGGQDRGAELPGTESAATLQDPASEPVAKPEGPLLGPDEATALRGRVGALEAEVESLTIALRDANENVKPMLALYERLEADGLLAADGQLGGNFEIVGGTLFDGDGGEASSAASELGLGGDRRQAFADEARRILDEIETLEKAHAELTVDGSTMTLEIGRYADEGGRLARQWDDWVAANLTTEEQAAHTKRGTKSRLFGNRLGLFDRTIEIRESNGALTLRERATTGDGDEEDAFESEMSAPSEARDLVLKGYRHLLK